MFFVHIDPEGGKCYNPFRFGRSSVSADRSSAVESLRFRCRRPDRVQGEDVPESGEAKARRGLHSCWQGARCASESGGVAFGDRLFFLNHDSRLLMPHIGQR